MLEPIKEDLVKDLKERPGWVLVTGNIVSYVHNPDSDPMISEFLIRYNKKEYTFKISSITIKDKP